ncbi:MAG: transposase [Muribaculaceae bacterium]|nr:transposase [Muribaculaceae bacterium]
MEKPSFLNKDFIHSYERRKKSHDYKDTYKYHIILKKQEKCGSFGKVIGDASILPGFPGCADIKRSLVGSIIKKHLFNFDKTYTSFQMLQFKVMPDHVHILLQVKERLPKHLGYYIGRLKAGIAEECSRRMNKIFSAEDIFKPNYTDRIVWSFINLQTLIKYIKENPHRLAMRIQFPEFFKKMRNLKIDDIDCDLYGNLFLLRNPDKMPLVVHHDATEEEIAQIAEDCVCNVLEKGIIVTAAISRKEKEIRDLCENYGGSLIRIQYEEFSEKFHPSEHDSDLCKEGRLLIISIKYPKGTKLIKPISRKMNQLAERICQPDFDVVLRTATASNRN